MKYKYTKTLVLESEQNLAELELEYQTWGSIRYDSEGKPSNVVWVCHALTANAEVLDWWEGLFGENKCFDPKKHFIVCVNMLGSSYGSSNPLSPNPQTQKPYYHDFPLFTIRDIVKTLDLLREDLGIEKINYCLGGSMGGQQAMEWAIMQPELIENLFLIATNAQHSPWGIAFNESQRMAIEHCPTWQDKRSDAGLEGMKVARAMALISYRNYHTYQMTQKEDNHNKIDNFRASSYQKYQGEKLAQRNFNAFSYWYLSKAMDSHNVARGRKSMENALGQIKAKTLVASVASDLLFPPLEQEVLATNINRVRYESIESIYGHDGFLIETENIEKILKDYFEEL